MSNDSIIKNSSMLLAYLGGLGWGSAYFYGWGVSAYYGFPWWYVGVGPDNIARSLFHAISLMAIFIIAWGVGILLFFVVKQKARINDLSFLRLFLQLFCSLFQLLSNFLS
ncbi:putative inner membrane protein [Salmonella enterica subsp. salamae]|nr:putative inner membrane protein [Salmonella enterica subsp. salamae]